MDWSALAVVLFIVLIPVLFPMAAVLNWLYRRCVLAAARTTTCPRCVTLLGQEGVRLTAAQLKRWADGMSARNMRCVRRAPLDVLCSSFGAHFLLDRKTRTLAVQPDIVKGQLPDLA